MIVAVEPNCRNFSHETFNLAILYGLSLAYPQDEILFFADKSHNKVLKENISLYGVDLSNVEFRNIAIWDREDIIGLWQFKIRIKEIFGIADKENVRAFYFFSTRKEQQLVIKEYACLEKYKDTIFSMNLHGEADTLAYPDFHVTKVDFPEYKEKKGIISRIKEKNVQIPGLIAKKARHRICQMFDDVMKKISPRYVLSNIMKSNNAPNIRYVCLAQYIKDFMPRFIDTSGMNLRVLTLPAIYGPIPNFVKNTYFKIAVFGYGHSALLYKLNCILAKKNIINNYEIRIIGMDGQGINNFPHTVQPINDKLTREQMKELAEDIDMFLILYEKERYVLSCSGSIIEAHSYVKPVLYLDNECINYFNNPDRPIGICCNTLDDMADKMVSIINNYQDFLPHLDEFRKNMIQQRNKIDISSNLDMLKNVVEK